MFVAVSCQVPNVPFATFIPTLSVLAPNQAYSQSWIVPAPFVARWVSHPLRHHPVEDFRRAVPNQMSSVNARSITAASRSRARRIAAALPRTFSITVSGNSGGGESGSTRISSTRVKLARFRKRVNPQPIQIQRFCSHVRPRAMTLPSEYRRRRAGEKFDDNRMRIR